MDGLLRRFAPLRKRFAFVAGNDAAAMSDSNFKQHADITRLVRNCALGRVIQYSRDVRA
jgi:hypothetical protein